VLDRDDGPVLVHARGDDGAKESRMKWPPGTLNAEKLRYYRQRAAALGLCYTCRCRPKTETSRYCAECLDLGNRVEAERVARNRRGGLCACGNEPRLGWKTCERCARKALRGRAKLVARKEALGLCLRCDSPRADGHNECEACLVAGRERAKRARRERIAAGKCGTFGCNSKLKAGHSMCRACLKEMRETHSPRPGARIGRVMMRAAGGV
jgi:hypothetical protein